MTLDVVQYCSLSFLPETSLSRIFEGLFKLTGPSNLCCTFLLEPQRNEDTARGCRIRHKASGQHQKQLIQTLNGCLKKTNFLHLSLIVNANRMDLSL